jgi:hypothetical protein
VSDHKESEEQPELLEQMIRNEPPPTAQAKAKYVDDYIAKLHAIRQAHSDDPLLASERTLSASKAFVAGLSPAGQFRSRRSVRSTYGSRPGAALGCFTG